MLSKITDWLQTTRTGLNIYLFLDQLMQYVWGLEILIRDIGRFFWWSSAFRLNYSEFSLESKLIAVSHRIEKAYSLPETRLGFGRNTIYELIDLLKLHNKRGYSKGTLGFRMATRALRFYMEKHMSMGFSIGEIESEIGLLISETELENLTHPVPAYLKGEGFAALAQSRASIRRFADKPVDVSLINKALDAARFSPSVCNRQAWRVHAYHNQAMKQKLLDLQGGSRGFGHTADWVLVVTVDLAAFLNVKERFEVYVDGGLFSMSLMYALREYGLGTCALNWCTKPSKDRKIRKLISIGDSEEIIMLIAVGHFNENEEIAYSEKRSIAEIITYSD